VRIIILTLIDRLTTGDRHRAYIRKQTFFGRSVQQVGVAVAARVVRRRILAARRCQPQAAVARLEILDQRLDPVRYGLSICKS